MATQSLGRIFFPIFRKTSGDSGRSLDDPLGVFSCNMNAARFLDIDKLSIAVPVMIRERKAGQRSITLADGTQLKQTSAGTEIAKSQIISQISGNGSRTVILTTGKLIADSKRAKGKENAHHTISFRFPSFCTLLNISEALGEIIPPAKIKNPPTATDIWGYYVVKGGGRYPIAQQAAAKASTTTSVPLTAAELQAIVATKQGVTLMLGAGS